MRKYNLVGLFLLGFLLVSTSFGFVAASDDDGDGVDDEFEESHKRDIDIEFSPGEFQIESHLRNGQTIDEVELKVKYDVDGLEVEVSYEENVETENTTGREIEFEVEFRKLIEYVDSNINGLYDDGVDQLIQEVQLNSFQPVIYSTSIISTDTTLHYVIVNTTDGVFTAHVFFTEEFTIVNDSFITPTETKIDIEITDFNYIDNNSQLALYIKMGSEIDYEEDDVTDDEENEYSSDEDGIVTHYGEYSGIFTWKENATVDGIIMDVLANQLESDDINETEQKLLLNYPRGNHIYHDPKIGIVFGQVPTSNLPFIIVGVVGSILVVGIVGTVIVVRKRRTV
ncbi:MAG: hypothetical protein ACW986_11395 [Promethearchaeota archaeon]